jgi:hypothetical protein
LAQRRPCFIQWKTILGALISILSPLSQKPITLKGFKIQTLIFLFKNKSKSRVKRFGLSNQVNAPTEEMEFI